MTADHAVDEAEMAEMVETLLFPVALAACVDEGQVARPLGAPAPSDFY